MGSPNNREKFRDLHYLHHLHQFPQNSHMRIKLMKLWGFDAGLAGNAGRPPVEGDADAHAHPQAPPDHFASPNSASTLSNAAPLPFPWPPA
jgi:hypothetical protein